MGTAPAYVSGCLENRGAAPDQIEDTATVLLGAQDVEAEIFLTWAADRRQNRIVITGRESRLTLDGATLAIERTGRTPETRSYAPGLEEGSHHPDWFAGVVEDFLAAIRADNPSKAANLDEASLCARLIEGAKRSAAAGGAPQSLPSGARRP
jgi:predicted dehydrogenase